MNKKVVIVLGGVVLYLLAAGGSFAYFSQKQAPNTFKSPVSDGAKTTGTGFKRDPSLPRNEACPLNGAMYTTPEKTAWETRRPLGVMIENTKEARPQSGLSSADVVYEAIAEGGIPRFLAVFYCQDPEIVGPVRSARTYFLDWISEYGDYPWYLHIGGANTSGPANALGQIKQYGWYMYNDLEGLGSYDFPSLFIFADPDRIPGTTATEHIKYNKTTNIWGTMAQKRKLTNITVNEDTGKESPWNKTFVSWKFKDDAGTSDRPQSFAASFNLSNIEASYAADYGVKWQYDPTSNSYLRFNGGVAHNDNNSSQQILAKNVILEFMTMSIADDGYSEEGHGTHTLYGNKGQGKVKILMDGKVIDGTWTKKTRLDRTKFFDITGKEIALNRGLTWIEILPISQTVTVL